MDTPEHAPRNAWLQSKRLTWVLLAVLVIGALVLITWLTGRLPSLWPFAIILCPLMMVFMMMGMHGMGGGHADHERDDGPDQQGRERKANIPSSPGADLPVNHLSALEILRQRYAHGEIDTATFEQQRERLEASVIREPQTMSREVTYVSPTSQNNPDSAS